ncbi:MAG: JAB domain-containing protein [Fidelibacterota bacterium]
MTQLSTIPDDMLIQEYKARFYIRPGKPVSNPIQTRHHLASFFEKNDKERFVVMYLSSWNRVIETEVISEGSISSAHIYARELLKRVLSLNAAAVVVSHNHPSGNPEPSREDVDLTQKLRDLLKLMDVALLDHIIIAGDRYISLADKGCL